MVYAMSKIAVVDNTGVKKIHCIRMYRPSKNPRGQIGVIGLAAVSKALPNELLRRGDLVRFIILATNRFVRRSDGSAIQCPQTTAALVSKQSSAPIGRRITGPVLKELRVLGHLKILSIATIVV